MWRSSFLARVLIWFVALAGLGSRAGYGSVSGDGIPGGSHARGSAGRRSRRPTASPVLGCRLKVSVIVTCPSRPRVSAPSATQVFSTRPPVRRL
jgi:hypothetical protein